MDTPQRPGFASFEYLFAASSSPWNAVSSEGGTQSSLFYGEKVTEGEDSNLSSFWLPSYATGMPEPMMTDEELESTTLTSLAMRDVRAATPGVVGDSASQNVHWSSGTGYSSSMAPEGTINPADSQLSSYFLGNTMHDAGSQFYGQRNIPPSSFLPQPRASDIDAFTRPPRPSPSPSSLSSVASLTTMVESENEDSDYLFTQGDGEHLPPMKATSKSVAERAHNGSTEYRGKKRTGAAVSAFKSHKSKKPSGRQLRRNVQVTGSIEEMAPIRRRGSEYGFQCPVCGRRMRRYQEMKRHIDTHLGKGSMCPVCGKLFARVDATRRHINADSSCRLQAKARKLVPIDVYS